MNIQKGSIVTQYMENIKLLDITYSLMYIGQVVDKIGNRIILDPTIMGYKLPHMDTYKMFRVVDVEGIEEDITPTLRLIEPHEFEDYMIMLDKIPISIESFNEKLTAARIQAQEQTPETEELEDY
jgi:oligoribonuclease (3'-5' exoribonuclease)